VQGASQEQKVSGRRKRKRKGFPLQTPVNATIKVDELATDAHYGQPWTIPAPRGQLKF